MSNNTNEQLQKPLISLIIPAYNEEEIIIRNLTVICEYLNHLTEKYRWEVLLINDGSTDKTGFLADQFAAKTNGVKVFHHIVNMNLGNALKTGFANVRGDFTITFDLDLSYDTYHIGNLLETLICTKAEVVIASPYMKGGKVTSVPFMRLMLSRWVNRFMRVAAQEKLFTYTGMVRGYQTEFLKSLNLKTRDYEINPEILYKAMILRARIVEIPAHLDWTAQTKPGFKRKSGMRILKTFFSGLMAGFIFRPYFFFLGLGLVLLFISIYILGWIFFDTFQLMPGILMESHYFDDRFSMAIGQVYRARPHAFFVGGITLMLSIQILSLGFISLQNKRYFEEIFHISTTILKEKILIKSSNY